ncbi:MAG: polysaccharide biosynthesis tyrosine autokinase [Thermoguttaceae bacterium]|nr:polysaccharide biosynthesis tyrosine autokinase [Thermoguttaceae bacterium]MDW8079821.1 polysaccharide biosynthesis tyrosine autokinase [Thermoguttaceae bacterium]
MLQRLGEGMRNELSAGPAGMETVSAAQMVHAFARFLLAVRSRYSLLVASLIGCGVLGGLYLLVATRYYAASAQVLIVEANHERGTPQFASEDRWQRTLMPTHRSLIRSAKVLERAIAKLSPEHQVDFLGRPKDRWTEFLQGNLSVSSPQNTNILEVRYRSRDPHTAAVVVDAVVSSYMQFIDETYQGTARQILEILTREKTELEARLAKNENELLALRQQAADLGYSSETRTTHPLIQRAMDLNAKLMEARSKRISLEVTWQQVQQAIQAGTDLNQYVLSVAELVGQELIRYRLGLNTSDATLQARLSQTLLEDQAKLQTLLTERGYGWGHPEVVALQEKIRRTQEFLQNFPQWVKMRSDSLTATQVGPALLEIISQKVAEAQLLEASLARQYEEAQAEAVALTGTLARIDILAREVEWLRNLRQVLLQRMTELDTQQKGQELRAFVIAEPEVNPVPVSPDWRFVLLAALMGGIGLGLGLIYVVDILDDRFRSIEELQAATGVPVLATVRNLQLAGDGGIETLPAFANPNSAESEAFRTLRTALALTDHETNLLVVTSAQPGEGKTTILANLAVAMARAGKRTLLIDADLRRPGLTALLRLRGRVGLSAIIRSEDDLEAVVRANIVHTPLETLDVIPAGARPSNPAELLGSQRFSELLAWAEGVYDQVFVDSPPILATSDAAVIGRLTGAVLLVIQPAKTTRRMILRTVESFQLLRIPVVGVVLNRIDSREGGYYGYEYYGYGYDSHYGEDHEEHEVSEEAEAAEKATPALGFAVGAEARDKPTPAETEGEAQPARRVRRVA